MKKNGTIIAGMLMIANFLVKILGLFREILLAQFYGTSIYTDAYIIANNIPAVLFAAIGASIATTFVPMFARVKEEYGEKRANAFALHMIECLVLICAVMTIIGEVFIRQFVFIFASGYEGEVLELTVSFSRILFPTIFALALMNLMGAYLQQHSAFLPIALVPIVGNSLIIISLFLSNITNNIYILVYGTLIGSLSQVLFYIPWIVKMGIINKEKISLFKDNYLSMILILIIPVFIGEAVNEINSIIDRTLVSGLDIGSVSALNYAYKMINLMIGVFVASIGTVVLPKLSKIAAEKDLLHLQKYGSDLCVIIIMIMVPITISLVVFRIEIIQLIFQRGNFNDLSTLLTGNAMALYAVGLVGMSVRDVLTKIFYSMQKTKIPMVNGIICALLNIILDLILIKKIGLYGAALATGVSAMLAAIIMMITAKSNDLIIIKAINTSILKIVAAGTVLSLFDLFAKALVDRIVTESFYLHILVCGIVGVVGIVIYVVINRVLNNLSVLKNI